MSAVSARCVATLFFCLISALSAHAAPLLGAYSAGSHVTYDFPSTETTLSALIAIGPLNSNCFNLGACPQFALLEGINSSANGTTITIDEGDSNFLPIVSALKDGVLDYISIGMVRGTSYGLSSGGASGYPETALCLGPDLAGLAIDSFKLRIDHVQILDGYDLYFQYTLSAYGEESVPEPATWLTGALGCGALMWKRDRRSTGTSRH